MSRLTVRQHIRAPLAETFERFVDFERYPEFMKAARAVRPDQENPEALRFTYSVAGIERQYSIVVNVDHDGSTVTWHSVDGPKHTGTAGFREVNPTRCALTLDVELRSSNFVDATGAVLGFVRGRVEHDLQRFATHVEQETGNRPPPGAPDNRAPSEKLFDAVFPTDERRKP